jgi:peptide/nickel transport system permease protein
MSESLVVSPDISAAAHPTATGAAGSRLARIGRQVELWVPGAFLIFLCFICFIWPLVYPMPDPVAGNLAQPNLAVLSPGHLLGTDPLGNDVMSRLLYGGRISLEVGVGSSVLGLVIGGLIGIIAGFCGGAVDTCIARVLDIFLAFPALVLTIVVAAYLGPSELNVIWAICFFSIPAFARLARSHTFRVCALPFVRAARLSGARSWRVILRHIVPNIFPEMLTFCLIGVSIAIGVEASLSFLGVGIPPPAPSWGNMIQVGQQNIYTSPALLVVPAIALFLTVLALNLLGDALRARWAAR